MAGEASIPYAAFHRQSGSLRRSTSTRSVSLLEQNYATDDRMDASLLEHFSPAHVGLGENDKAQDTELQLLPCQSPSAGEAHGPGSVHSSQTFTLRQLFDMLATISRERNARFQHWKRTGRFTGWRFGVLIGFIVTIAVLVSNIILLLLGAFLHGGYKDGVAELANGNSSRISTINAAYHIVLNILSTLLLGASNYSMQVLSAPTRSDVDHAHQKGQWLDIGILSFRNLRYIDRRRSRLWWILACSSVPLHLL